MPWQLIYTSAPRGLVSGQSGFCTVARSADLREALAQRLEQISSYHYLRVSEAATAKRNPTVSVYRLLDLRGAKYYVLTRIQPCGLDFTARTNHLAHHLVFQADELAALPSPAAILRLWPGWLASWQGEPRLLEEPGASEFAAAAKSFLPAQTWARMTGDGGRAAGLLESECVRGCYLVCPPDSEEQMLEMYAETLQLLNFNGQFPLRPWRHPFTTFLQAEDNPNDFQWRACQENTPAYKQAVTRSAPLIPLQAVRVPGNSLVKLAREAPKPPSAPPPTADKPAVPTPAASRNKLSIQKKPAVSAPVVSHIENALAQKTKCGRPVFRFSIHSATLASLGIFAAVLAALLWVKYSAKQPEEVEEKFAPVSSSNLLSVVEMASAPSIPSNTSPKVMTALDAKQLSSLTGDGPTYILGVPNLTNFSLPMNDISPLQNLLKRYDKLESGTLPNDIQLTVGIDRWDFPPGARLTVAGTHDGQFAASGSGLDLGFDYGGWLSEKGDSLAVQANFDRVPSAFSMHFGFSSTNGGDPFRLLFVNEHHPPAPLSLAMQFVQKDRKSFQDSLEVSMRRCLLGNFILLAGRQWQLEPFIGRKPNSEENLYQDWPEADRPALGCELDFAHIGQRLRTQRQDLQKKLDVLRQPLGRPLGQYLGVTNDNLKSLLAFSPNHLTASRFLEYLNELKKSAPDKSWIREWHNRPDSDQPEEVSANLQELYDLWILNQPRDQAMLMVTNQSRTTNYFFDTWRRLNETFQEREAMQTKLESVQKRLVELDEVAYIGLLIVDPNQPGPGLEMVRFGGP